MTDVYVCKESGAFEWDGDMVVVNKGVTRVRKGHPMLDAHPELFEEITVHYDVERATAEPGTKRALALPEPPAPREPAADPAKASPPAAVDDLDALRKQAEDAGVRVDRRWGAEKLREQIDAAENTKNAKNE